MKTFAEVAEWCDGAFKVFGDPSVPVCQLFFRWQDLRLGDGGDDDTLVCGMLDREFVIVWGPSAVLPLPVRTGEPEVSVLNEEVIAYGAVLVVDGVWAIAPSLNVPGFIHAFVVLYGVPDPAPWGKGLIVLP